MFYLLFSYLQCQRCGKIVSIEYLEINMGRYICKDCANLQTGKTCNMCINYNKLTHQCILDKRMHLAKSKCTYTEKDLVKLNTRFIKQKNKIGIKR